ncbi:hypothetical protein [Rahnella victoriana]|uniref:Uncharacterized protein n=1 Tax=Rahnella victoriana TaxID=1510570 RepID=A0ABS0DQ30_9GAMM|nr:hypothetical protein [Rahnella victoriana]MBF7955999.1 hypothetical protein [Rahnella victoriana]PBI82362.1 hypothetical protein A9993_06570 [Rahnella victoriana]
MASVPLSNPGSNKNQQFKTAIKLGHYFLTAYLLVMVGGYYLLNQQDDTPDTLITVSQLNSDHWLYMTERNTGGATVPITHRYYIEPQIKGSDPQIAKQLSELEPLISGMGSINDIHIDDKNRVTVSYSGRFLNMASGVDQVTFEIQR